VATTSNSEFVIPSIARNLAFSYIPKKDFSAEFILSEVEAPRNDNWDKLSCKEQIDE